jgi:hypothetical protein
MIPASLAKTLQQKELCVGTSSAGFFVAMVEAFWCVTRRLNWKAITKIISSITIACDRRFERRRGPAAI